MSKVLIFSRFFPAYHPKAGQPTFFVEKIYEGMEKMGFPDPEFSDEQRRWLDANFVINIYDTKHHTIRAGNRWKVGDKFSPRVWSGKPYKSKQIIIAPDIEVKKVWEIEIYINEINGQLMYEWCMPTSKVETHLSIIAKNDGLSLEDLKAWFKKPFKGQIICWNDKIEY